MNQPQQPRPVLQRPAFVVSPAAVADIDAIWALDSLAFAQPWSRASFVQAFLDAERSTVLVARPSPVVNNGVTAGAGSAVVAAAGPLCGFGVGWSAADEGEIATLAVAPPWRRQGVASVLMHALVQSLAQRGARTIFLEVRPSNSGAEALYTQLGFVAVGRRRRYYDNGEDAIIMKIAVADAAPAAGAGSGRGTSAS